jgi:hypothetical protein
VLEFTHSNGDVSATDNNNTQTGNILVTNNNYKPQNPMGNPSMPKPLNIKKTPSPSTFRQNNLMNYITQYPDEEIF